VAGAGGGLARRGERIVPLTILLVAYPLALVAPGCVGGAEEIVRLIDDGIHAAGHHAIVVAREGSRVSGTLVPVPAIEPPYDDGARQRASESAGRAIEYVLSRWAVDVVHFHGIDFPSYLPAGDARMVATLHLPIEWYPAAVLHAVSPRVRFVCVSQSQQLSADAAALQSEVIENGVDIADPPIWRKGSYVVAMGRICPEKAFHEAIDAARLAGVDLLLAGCAFPFEEHQRYFDEAIRPRLDGRRRFVGPANGAAKRRLLACARCVLVTSRAPETSSLVAMEALTLGTPVIAFPSGALPEIVEHGRTGFIARTVEEMAAAIHSIDLIQPDDCRRSAARFSAARMCSEYLRLYQRNPSSRSASPSHSTRR
jgi:glycosyltransferase involved in cell wall biosynthesis